MLDIRITQVESVDERFVLLHFHVTTDVIPEYYAGVAQIKKTAWYECYTRIRNLSIMLRGLGIRIEVTQNAAYKPHAIDLPKGR